MWLFYAICIFYFFFWVKRRVTTVSLPYFGFKRGILLRKLMQNFWPFVAERPPIRFVCEFWKARTRGASYTGRARQRAAGHRFYFAVLFYNGVSAIESQNPPSGCHEPDIDRVRSTDGVTNHISLYQLRWWFDFRPPTESPFRATVGHRGRKRRSPARRSRREPSVDGRQYEMPSVGRRRG